MSVVNKVKNFFSRSYVSHFDDNNNLKDFEHFRIDLVKELDYMVLRHKFDVRESTTNAGLYNKIQSSLGDIADDIKHLSPLKLVYDSSLCGFYSLVLPVSYFSFHKINLIHWCLKLKERFSSPGNFILGPKVSEFHWYGYMLDDPYHYPPEHGYYGREYEDLIRASSIDFYHDHKIMIEYDNSSYLKLAVISFTDILEDTATFLNSSVKSMWNLMWLELGLAKNNLLDSCYHVSKIFFDIAAGGIYTICSIVENFDPYVESVFGIIDNIIVSTKNDIEYHIDNKVYELFGEHAKNASSKSFDIIENSYFMVSDIVKCAYHIITFSGEKAAYDVFNIFMNAQKILINIKHIFEYIGLQFSEYTKNYYTELAPSDEIIKQINNFNKQLKLDNSQNSVDYIKENYNYYLNYINSQANDIYNNTINLFGEQLQSSDEFGN